MCQSSNKPILATLIRDFTNTIVLFIESVVFCLRLWLYRVIQNGNRPHWPNLLMPTKVPHWVSPNCLHVAHFPLHLSYPWTCPSFVGEDQSRVSFCCWTLRAWLWWGYPSNKGRDITPGGSMCVKGVCLKADANTIEYDTIECIENV